MPPLPNIMLRLIDRILDVSQAGEREGKKATRLVIYREKQNGEIVGYRTGGFGRSDLTVLTIIRDNGTDVEPPNQYEQYSGQAREQGNERLRECGARYFEGYMNVGANWVNTAKGSFQ